MRFDSSIEAFGLGISRAEALCVLHGYIEDTSTAAVDTTDMLRAAVILGVSSLDYLMHELVRIECAYRTEHGLPVSKTLVPLNLIPLGQADCLPALDAHLREINSYKSFVAPEKLADALRAFFENPWGLIAAEAEVDQKVLRNELRSIVVWRNRIAHEADINPTYGGTLLWPIYSIDVSSALSTLDKVGRAAVAAILNNEIAIAG